MQAQNIQPSIQPVPSSVRFSLLLGIAVPVLYFGIQILAAPFFANFSLLSTTASDLGSERSSFPLLFNLGTLLGGLAAWASVYGFVYGLKHIRSHVVWVALVALVVLMLGGGFIWAAIFPLPHPSHANYPLINFTLLIPLLMPLVLWKQSTRAQKIYYSANLIVFVLMAAIMSGATAIDTQANAGLLQRLLAITVFVPIGVASYSLLGLLRR